MKLRGCLIVICGIDGSGKSTQEQILAEAIRASGRDVMCTRQPSDWYRNLPEVRAYLDSGASPLSPGTIALLAAADRMMHLETVVEPALVSGTHVICNRYVYSSYGYFHARGVDREFVADINSAVPKPDLGIFLRTDPLIAVRRVMERGERRKFEEKSAAYLKKVQDEMLRTWPEGLLVVDGAQPVREISSEIESYVLPKLQA